MKAEVLLSNPVAAPKAKKPFFKAKKKLNVKLNEAKQRLMSPVVTKTPEAAVKPADQGKKTTIETLKKPVAEIKSTAKKHKKHKTPETVRDEMQRSAILPAHRSNNSAANRSQVDTMSGQPSDKFNKENFRKKLQEQIDATIKSKDEAKEIKRNGGVKPEVSDQIGESINDEKAKAGGKVEASTAPPVVPTTPEREITNDNPIPLVAETPQTKTTTRQKADLAPSKKPDAETDLTSRTKTLDDQYSQNNLSAEKLQNSNEPKFVNADNQKETSQEKAKQLTTDYRQQERKTITATQQRNANAINSKYNGMLQENGTISRGRLAQQSAKSIEENAIRDKVSKGFDAIFVNSNRIVLACFATIDSYIETVFSQQITDNLKTFSSRVASLLDDNTGVFSWIGSKITGNDRLSEIEIFDIAKKEFIEHMQDPIEALVGVVDLNLNLAVTTIALGKAAADTFWEEQPRETQRIADSVHNESMTKFAELESAVESKESAIIDSVTEKFAAALEDLDARFEKAKEENKSWLDRAIDAVKAVINTIIELKNALVAIARKAAQYASEILDDPIGFFDNLCDGVGQGFTNFKNNIDKHLVKGVLEWLTGSMGSDIILPKELNLEGITSLVLQILGITIQKIKTLVKDAIGPQRFEFIEKGVEAGMEAGNNLLNMFKILNEKGLAGLWEFICNEFSDLKEMLIENVKSFVIETITRKAVEILLSLLIPGAGFIRAAQLLIRFVITLFQKAAQIMKIIEGIIDSFGNILRRDLGGAAAKVESVFSSFLSLAISFLAAVLGLDGIVGKVQKFIQQKIRPKIDMILKKIALSIKQLITKIGLDKLIDKSMVAVQKGKDWVNEKKEKAKETAAKYGEKVLKFLGIKKKFKTENGELHSLYFTGNDDNMKLMVASSPKTFKDFLKEIGKVKGDKAKAKKDAEDEFDALQTTLSKRNTGSSSADYQTEQVKKYDKVTGHVNTLSNYMPPLFDIKGVGKFELNFGGLTQHGFAKKMEIKNLHKSTKPPIGSVPGVTNDAYDELKKKRNGNSTFYILGHLLNHNLGGSGNDFRNLTPLTRKGNKDHNVDIEETAKSDLKAGLVINYTVQPDYGKTVKNKPATVGAKRKAIIDVEEKTPVRVGYLYKSWKTDEQEPQSPKKEYFDNTSDYNDGTYDE
ncbi:hypothetical protein [Flavobacterium sp.]|uniref:hypothetical protein n=1 Tax=Flavobacterium sp. TaxID=239 RepID=UPI00286BBA02|nr:hypothetical protein [Flavobacterium sp.]